MVDVPPHRLRVDIREEIAGPMELEHLVRNELAMDRFDYELRVALNRMANNSLSNCPKGLQASETQVIFVFWIRIGDHTARVNDGVLNQKLVVGRSEDDAWCGVLEVELPFAQLLNELEVKVVRTRLELKKVLTHLPQ
jgi:hypothetical protein